MFVKVAGIRRPGVTPVSAPGQNLIMSTRVSLVPAPSRGAAVKS